MMMFYICNYNEIRYKILVKTLRGYNKFKLTLVNLLLFIQNIITHNCLSEPINIIYFFDSLLGS